MSERDRDDRDRKRSRADEDDERDRKRSRTDDRDRDRDRERERERERERDRDRDRDRDRERDKEREREREREKERERRDKGADRSDRSERDKDSKDNKDNRDNKERRPELKETKEEATKRELKEVQANDAMDVEVKSEAKSEMTTQSKEEAAKEKEAPKVPLDLEQMVTQTPTEAETKPVFLTKQQRRELALKKREEEVSKMREAQEEERKAREDFIKAAANAKYDERRERERQREEERRREREKEREKREKERQEKEGGSKEGNEGAKDKGESKVTVKDDERARELERETIKKTYMGLVESKKRVFKASDKFRFNFDWNVDEDTSRDINPLYNDKLEIKPMFGRGFIGGADHSQQSEDYQEHSEAVKKAQKLRDELAKATDAEEIARMRERLEHLERREKVNLHWSKKRVEEMTQRDWRIFREDHNITTKGGGIPNPIRSWDEAPLPDWLRKAVDEAGYKAPTPIQMQAIPMGLAGRDILGIAQTGSGKTASFVLPLLCYISQLPRMTKETQMDGPYALIMAPTRELALQISKETERFASPGGYRTVLLVGGQDIEQQSMKLRAGCEIIVATPGRLKDVLDSQLLVLNQCNFCVLDEADRMIEEGFEVEVQAVLDAMPKDSLKSEEEELAEQQERLAAAMMAQAAGEKAAPRDMRNRFRTTFMFSATMPPPVERLSRKYLRRAGQITIGAVGRAVDRIKQVVIFTRSEADKKQQLEELIRHGPPPPMIIFVNQRKKTDTVAHLVESLGYTTTTLQGGLAQEVREECLQEFRDGKAQVLVATDVAGRGIDVKGVTHVINYDLPKDIDSYTHRIGRTGRAGASGLATSFLSNDDTELMYDLKKMLMETNNAVPAELANHEAAKVKPGTVVQQARHKQIVYA